MSGIKQILIHVFSCFRILARKNCICKSRCSQCCFCETDVMESDTHITPTIVPIPAHKTVKSLRRQLPAIPIHNEKNL